MMGTKQNGGAYLFYIHIVLYTHVATVYWHMYIETCQITYETVNWMYSILIQYIIIR